MSNMFGTRENNDGDNRKSVNTRVYQFKNKDGFEPSTLQVGAWDEMFSLRINPALEPSKQTKEQVFDYNRFVATSLNMEKAMLLLYKIKNDIIPAMDNDEDKNVGISLGGDSLITVGTGKKITGSIKPYVSIHKGLDPETKKSEQSIFYEFKTSMSVDDYDPETGEYNIQEGYNMEFKLFIELLKSFISNCNFVGHSDRYANRFFNDKLMNTVNSIASKVGADTGYSGNSFSKKVVFGSTPKSNDYDLEEPTDLKDLNDLNDLIND